MYSAKKFGLEEGCWHTNPSLATNSSFTGYFPPKTGWKFHAKLGQVRLFFMWMFVISLLFLLVLLVFFASLKFLP